jgi:hypothetical protein
MTWFFISLIGVLSGIVQIAGYFIYLRHVTAGNVRPNTASWSIWAFGAVLESLSYLYLAQDIFKSILPIACALCAVLFFIYCIFKGHFGKISKFETAIVIIDIVITLVWYITSSPLIANILFIITAVISFVPIIIHVFKNPKNEAAPPWIIWTIAYGLQIITVSGRFEKVDDLFYPIVFFILHLIVAIFALKNKQQFSGGQTLHKTPHELSGEHL